jgi:hypothetical protein
MEWGVEQMSRGGGTVAGQRVGVRTRASSRWAERGVSCDFAVARKGWVGTECLSDQRSELETLFPLTTGFIH